MLKVNNIRQLLREAPVNEEGMKEIIGACFLADEPSIFGTVNEDYVRREIDWYKSMSLNVNDIEKPIPKIWEQVADEEGKINSNYGWCIFSGDNHYQFVSAASKLKQNPNTRQAIMIYNRPAMHHDAGKDFMCTNAVTYYIRDDKVHCVVQMRSNDAVYGYKNDFAWQKYVLGRMAELLGYPTGDIIWQVSSLHIYPRHFDLLYKEKSLI